MFKNVQRLKNIFVDFENFMNFKIIHLLKANYIEFSKIKTR